MSDDWEDKKARMALLEEPHVKILTIDVRKASGMRLRADMARAAQILDSAALGLDSMLTRAYILGALEAESSLTVRACLLTAWGW